MKKKKWIWGIVFLPLLIVLLGWLIPKIRGITPEDILLILPSDIYAVTAIILCLYVAKTISIMFPIVALYMTAGMLYPLWQAMLINFVGTVITLTIGYVVGFFCGEKWFVKLEKKYKNVKRLEEYRNSNQLVFAYITRVVGVLPCDILSWYMGNRRMHYGTYLAGSIMGMLPILVLNTFFGERLAEGISMEILILGVILIAVSFLLSYLGNKVMKKIYG